MQEEKAKKIHKSIYDARVEKPIFNNESILKKPKESNQLINRKSNYIKSSNTIEDSQILGPNYCD